MPTWLKVVLGVVAGFVVLLAMLVGGGVMWFRSHKGELVKAGEAAMKEGRDFGVRADRPGCIAEGFRRLPAVDGLSGEIKNNLFTKGCLDVASDSPGFCTDVPETAEIMATVKWRAGQCAGHSEVDPQRCQRFLQVWQESCHPRGGRGG